MQSFHRTARRSSLLPIPLLVATLAACATNGAKLPPEEAYRQAVEETRQGHHQEARRLFEQVRDADTPVRLELLAEIGIADALYKNSKYEEAAAAYSRLFEIHSGDAIADYLKYQLGMCYYRRIDTIDRDQGLTTRARLQFMELVTRYPESDLVPAARENLRRCDNYLAERELYVGKFYFAKANYAAAKSRFERGLTEYGQVDVAPELLHHLALTVDALGDSAALQRVTGRLARDYADSPWSRDLQAALAEQRQRRVEAQGDGVLHRLRHWLSNDETPTEETTPAAAPPADGNEEASPAPQGYLDGDTISVAAHPDRRGWQWLAWVVGGVAEASTLNEAVQTPWPGATVAEAEGGAPSSPSEAATPTEPPSRWRRILTWLHGPQEEKAPPPAALVEEAPPAHPGLLIRRIPPVEREPAPQAATQAGSPETTVAPPEAAATDPSSEANSDPAPRTPLDTLVEGLLATHPAATPEPAPAETATAEAATTAEPATPTTLEAAPTPDPPTASVDGNPTTDPSDAAPVDLAATDEAEEEEPDLPAIQEAAPAPEETPTIAATSPAPQEVPPPVAEPTPGAEPTTPEPLPSDNLVVEQFFTGAEGAAPAAAPAATPPSPAPAGDPRPPLADRIEATLTAAQPVPATPQEATVRAVSGAGTRHQPPRPLPIPAYTRPVPPLSGEAELFPAIPAAQPTAPVEWLPLTAVEKRSSPPAPAPEPTEADPDEVEAVTAPAAAPVSETVAVAPAAPPDFWRSLRESYGRLAQTEE